MCQRGGEPYRGASSCSLVRSPGTKIRLDEYNTRWREVQVATGVINILSCLLQRMLYSDVILGEGYGG